MEQHVEKAKFILSINKCIENLTFESVSSVIHQVDNAFINEPSGNNNQLFYDALVTVIDIVDEKHYDLWQIAKIVEFSNVWLSEEFHNKFIKYVNFEKRMNKDESYSISYSQVISALQTLGKLIHE